MAFTKLLLIYQIYLNLPLPPFSFISPPPFLEELQQVSFFHYIDAYTLTIFTLLHFFPPSTSGINPLPGRTYSALLFSDFLKEKCCLFKIVTKDFP
jgi:hypothetical protein